MRSGVRCRLLEAEPGRLGALRASLTEAGAEVWCSPLAGGADDPPDAGSILVVDVPDADAGAALRRLAARDVWRVRAVLALVRDGDATTTSRAIAAGADDVLPLPVGEAELLERVAFAATLARARAELALRHRLFAAFRGGPPPGRPTETGNATEARILMVGPPGQAQMRLVAALDGARLAYAENETLPTILDLAGPFDLVVRTGAEALPAFSEGMSPQPPLVLVVPRDATAPEPASAPQALSVLRLPLPADLARLRLTAALRLSRLRAKLRRPPPDGSDAFSIDALTGLANQGFLLAYAASRDEENPLGRRHRSVVVALALRNLHGWGRARGYPAVNQALAAIGREIARGTRAEDLGAHLGEGRFVLLAEGGPEAAVGLCHRLAAGARRTASLPLGDPPEVAAVAEPPRPGETTARAVDRALINLGAAPVLGG